MTQRKMSEISRKKDKNQHIQVFVRVRPANKDEIHGKSSTVVEVASSKDVVVRERPQDSKLTKKFSFDRVFGPSSKQLDVYNAVVSPLLDEVLAGYNCTVFAYGQTGTGKTFTMEGVCNDPSVHWQSDTAAGIIPRSLNHLFDELRTLEAQEYTVKVSFLELYNEELFDLLSCNDDASKIRIYEDTTKKGAVIIHGLEEVTVHNKNEVYKILEKGSEKRQTAATLMNAHSSRSHTVFSITVHIKENTVEGEELLKTGKLNLVDLAGSENVGRSGAVDRRAREAGNINQSLLTLGRVITALVERAPHIPYRESKLTRLLQESLGGRTKTSIIATVSPAALNLEETLSTLDYAHRAKNITNRPEINQKLSKKALLKEYTEEIERLRRDLQATRDRNGVYLAHDNYNELQTTIEFQGKEIEEKINHIKALEETMINKEKILDELKMSLEQTQHQVKITEQERNEQKYLVERHVVTEKKLLNQASQLLKVVEIATKDTSKLHEKIERKNRVEQENEHLGEKFRLNIERQFEEANEQLSNYTQELIQFSLSTKDEINSLTSTNSKEIQKAIKLISGELLQGEQRVITKLEGGINNQHEDYALKLEDLVQESSKASLEEIELQKKMISIFSERIQELVKTGIADNLRRIEEENRRKLEELRDFMSRTVAAVCDRLLEDRNRLSDKINVYTDRINETIAAQTSLSRKKESFFEMFKDCFNEYERIHEEEVMVNDTAMTVSEEGLEFCKDIEVQMDKNLKNQTDIDKVVSGEFSERLQGMGEKLSRDLEVNWQIAEASVLQGAAVSGDVQKHLEGNCEKLQEFSKRISSKSSELRDKMSSDRAEVLSSVQEVHKLVSDVSVNHEELMEQHRRRIEATAGDMCKKLENQSVQSSEWSTQISSYLRTTQHQVDKFVVEDMRKDVPSGTTPAKRDFNYPKQLVMTSPHERIIQRFREMKCLEDSHEDTLRAQDETLKCSPVTCQESNESFASFSTPSDTSFIESDKLNGFTKSASTSDLSSVAKNLTKELVMRSTSDVACKKDNKENGIEGFVKPGDFKSAKVSKLKNPTRRILSSYNE
ncbi:bipolar kinesin KRP-130 [Fopius arisanus]|uniref:Bipolar kinesin KRP-130 n=1 Tax=Fopius arisanus TaxID=64838 RepID=A0A0C9RHS8_9HYME|nr:PREDICTED: bipolar kinesin KRP-130 [Fopius arisanus]